MYLLTFLHRDRDESAGDLRLDLDHIKRLHGPKATQLDRHVLRFRFNSRDWDRLGRRIGCVRVCGREGAMRARKP